MLIRCGICGEDIVVDGNLVDGQHVMCPYCGEKSVYRKPARIDLSEGVRVRLEPATPEAPTPTPTPPKSEKPDLHLRKAGVSRAASESSDERKIFMAEDRAKFYEGLRASESRRKALHNIVSIFALLGLAAVAVFAYMSFERRKEEKAHAELLRQREVERQRVEREAHEREERARIEAERRARAERDAAAKQARLAAENLAAEKIRAARERYRCALSAFSDGRFDFFSALPKDFTPDRTNGEYCYLMPFNESGKGAVIFSVVSNGVAHVTRLSEDGTETPESPEIFFSKLSARDFLMATREGVYFHGKRAKPHVNEMPKGKMVDVSEDFLGDVAPEAKAAKLDFDDVAFEIVFIPKKLLKNGKRHVIVTQVIEYGMPYDEDKIREAVEDAHPMRSSVSFSSKQKAFKRTVKFWDGAHIKRGVDGVTYVPHMAPVFAYRRNYSGPSRVWGPGWNYDRDWRNAEKERAQAQQTHDHWQSLCQKAKEEDAAEQAYYSKANAEREEVKARRLTADEERYKQKIDDILATGTLYWRARLKWKSAK